MSDPTTTGLGTFDLLTSVDVIEHLLDPDYLSGFIRDRAHAESAVLMPAFRVRGW